MNYFQKRKQQKLKKNPNNADVKPVTISHAKTDSNLKAYNNE